MEDINSQQNIREFSIQAFRKICDAMVLSPPKIVKKTEDWDDKRFLLLDELNKKVLEYTGAAGTPNDPGERPGAFMQKHQVIESLGKYWRVTSMNLETIIDEFVFNAIGPKMPLK
jgi:hypothetical protein